MDVLTLATIIMAVGTLLLAIVTYQNVKIAQKQLKAFQKQTNLLLIQNQPYLIINTFSFTENRFTAIIENINQALFNTDHSVFYEDYIHLYYPAIGKNLKVEAEFKDLKKPISVHPDGGKIQLTRSDYKSNFIKGLEKNISFSCEPFFHCSNLNEADKQLISKGLFLQYLFFKNERTFSKGYSFNELKELLLKNGITAIMVSFALVSKDLMENATTHDKFSAFIVDFDFDKSLEDAYKEKDSREIKGFTYGYSEIIESTHGYLPDYLYDNMREKNYEQE